MLLALHAGSPLAAPYLYVTRLFANQVDVVDLRTRALHDIIPVGINPTAASLNRDQSRLYVLNQTSKSLSIIDTTHDRVVQSVAFATPPITIAIPDNDEYVYVGLQDQSLGEASSVAVVDTMDGAVLLNQPIASAFANLISPDGKTYYSIGLSGIEVYDTVQHTTHMVAGPFYGSDGAALSADGATLYALATVPGVVTAIDTATLQAKWVVNVPWNGGNVRSPMAVSPDGSDVYVGNLADGSTAVIDAARGELATLLPTCEGPSGIAFSPDQRMVYVMCSFGSQVTRIDASRRSVIDTFPLGYQPTSSAHFVGAPPAPIYVANARSGTVSQVSTTDDTVNPLPYVGVGPQALAISPDGRWLYSANTGANTVSTLSLQDGTLAATVPVGAQPAGLAVSPQGTRLYVANSGSHSISVVDTAAQSVVATLPQADGVVSRSLLLGPGGRKLYVAQSNGTWVDVYDTASGATLTPIYIAYGAVSIALAPSGTQAFVTGFGNFVAPVSLDTDMSYTTWTVRTLTGMNPGATRVSQDGAWIYTVNHGDPNMAWNDYSISLFQTSDGQGGATLPLPADPSALWTTADGSRVYVALPALDALAVIDTASRHVLRLIGGFAAPSALVAPDWPVTNLIFQGSFD